MKSTYINDNFFNPNYMILDDLLKDYYMNKCITNIF